MTSKDNSKAALIDSLNGLLADSFALYLKTKNFHWHVRGPQFHDLHLLFDTHATEVFAMTDLVAERVRKLGGKTMTSIGSIAARTTIADEDDTSLDAMAMVRQLFEDNTAFVGTLKAIKELAGEAGDNATDGMIDDWTDQTEQRAWFLREILA
ncbi:Dps family protein [Novosphingobium mangrovi (ex Huang et al. 2023)]|uniref:DNA starvation/stationary phase protection protein n=1 Tax=Novosphingobium mangrovi (ex Huang et al. 2023) TaxID=2976432 RepID=A0ABT2HZT7_9SPHN|nr:DNA starvation/stationary phase protection protein [Novosphingobium mangrovi (ex Huang et al. 2023)]MCT2398057.1 DNA starvation/stationary phase protection protein [Novosphingobium mangrovi (ex Huang et al. 2023)]